MEDKEIIFLYNLRDENAIRETDKKYGKYCFSIADNILHDFETSKECVNDSYLKTWNSIPPKAPSSLRMFLAKIVRNLAFDRYKSKARQKRGGGEVSLALEEIKDFLPAKEQVETALEETELIAHINRFLRSLSSRDRCIFINRYFHVEPASTIAQKYSTSENNVHKILSRTRNKLKEFLTEEGYTI
ncbi:MAG: sigma-70 family RNA polymerase sigma factor [Ruminococcaceae bacterium]|nr:sigma-70 family RNA polymerase sigma factor [Oscillospiraceae bacterium]